MRLDYIICIQWWSWWWKWSMPLVSHYFCLKYKEILLRNKIICQNFTPQTSKKERKQMWKGGNMKCKRWGCWTWSQGRERNMVCMVGNGGLWAWAWTSMYMTRTHKHGGYTGMAYWRMVACMSKVGLTWDINLYARVEQGQDGTVAS